MKPIAYLGIHDVRDVELGRRRAMQQYIFGHGGFLDEFVQYIGKDITGRDDSEIYDKLDEFAYDRGLTIMSEKPYIVFDDENKIYRVDVGYTICME